MGTALVIGGTGPTGPGVVNGLLERGHSVAVLHGGMHEVDLPAEVEHIHTDPHFPETLQAVASKRTFDLIVAQYGRLSVIVDVFGGRTHRIIAIGAATGSLAGSRDMRWGPLGRPYHLDESTELLETQPEENKFGYRIAEAERSLFRLHDSGRTECAYLAYPVLYGPRVPVPHDWAIVRRVLDGRRALVVADGGLKLESRLYVDNAVSALLRALDTWEHASGQKFVVVDGAIHSMNQRIQHIGRLMSTDLELIDVPFSDAAACHPYWRFERDSRIRDGRRIRDLIGHTDAVDTSEGLRRTVEWLLENRPIAGGPEESLLSDPFDYATEDRVIETWRRDAATGSTSHRALHPYRHPKRPDEEWKAPSNWSAD